MRKNFKAEKPRWYADVGKILMKPKLINNYALFETYFLIVSKNGENKVNDIKFSRANEGASSLYFC